MKLNLVTSFCRFSRSSVIAVAACFVLAPVADKASTELGLSSSFVSVAAAAKVKDKRPLPGISESFFKKLGRVADLVSPAPNKDGSEVPPNYPAGLEELRKIEKGCEKCNGYELAQIYNYFGFVYYSMDDMKNAVKYYDLVVQQAPLIPWGLELQTVYTLSQLAFSNEDYSAAVKYLNRWMEYADPPSADAFYLRAQICYQMDDKKCASGSINTAVKMVEDSGKIAKESWYSIQKALMLEKEDYKSSLVVLHKLVRHYPKKSYWQQLPSVYGVLERDKEQYYFLDASYVAGAFEKDSHYLNLAYLSMANDYPYKAAKVLEEGMKAKIVPRSEKNLETLSAAWRLSQEYKKAIVAMKEAADKAKDDGNLYAQLMDLYLTVDDNKSAVAAGNKALKLGDLKQEGSVNLNVGIAYLNMEEYEDAIKSF